MPRAAADGDGRPTEDGEEPRRRRRRGGRGRGRGRGQERPGRGSRGARWRRDRAGLRPRRDPPRRRRSHADDEDADEDLEVAAPRGPRTNPFGSVWDSQIGTPASAAGAPRAPLVDEEDFEEPEIPEYLIAEQRRSGNRGGARSWRRRAWRSLRLPVGDGARALRPRLRWGRRDQPLPRREWPDPPAGSRARRPQLQPRQRSACPGTRRPQLERAVERRAAELEALLRAQVAQKPPVSRPAVRRLRPTTRA